MRFNDDSQPTSSVEEREELFLSLFSAESQPLESIKKPQLSPQIFLVVPIGVFLTGAFIALVWLIH